MSKINLKSLSPTQILKLTERSDFNDMFAKFSPEDKKYFLKQLQLAKSNNQVKSEKSIKVKQSPPVLETESGDSLINGGEVGTKKRVVINNSSPKQTLDKEPNIVQKAKNFGTAMKDWAKSGFKFASPEDYKTRMDICRKCPYWVEIPGPLIGKCKKCGCTGAKQKLASSRCPINKWTPVKGTR